MSDHDSTGKTCRACATHKPFTEFSNKKRSKDGLNTICRTCAAAQFKAYANKHKDEMRADRAEKYKTLTEDQWEKKRANNRAYWARNVEDIGARRRGKILTPDEIAQNKLRSRKWYLANRDEVLRKAANYYQQNREQIIPRVRAYERANPEKIRLLGRVKAHRRRMRLEVAGGTPYTRHDVERIYKLQKGCCASCRKKLKKKYHIDHRIPVAKGGDNTAGNIDLLCPNCNHRKSAKLPHVFAQENGRLI